MIFKATTIPRPATTNGGVSRRFTLLIVGAVGSLVGAFVLGFMTAIAVLGPNSIGGSHQDHQQQTKMSSTSSRSSSTTTSTLDDQEEDETTTSSTSSVGTTPSGYLQPTTTTTLCPNLGSFAPSRPIVIDKKKIFNHRLDRLNVLKQFTVPAYEKYMMSPAGIEHYSLLHWLTYMYGDCRHVVDIGTRYVASTLALSATGVPVHTYDLPSSIERIMAYRGKTQHQWFQNIYNHSVGNITFYQEDLLKINSQELITKMSTWLIVLDTAHLPDTKPFEREFLNRIINEVQYKGIIILDDIYLNYEMKNWWEEIQVNANHNKNTHPYRAYDITAVGHKTGTGLLDFTNGKVVIKI